MRPTPSSGLMGMAWLSSILFLAYIPAQHDWNLILPSVLVSFLSYIFLIRDKDEATLKWGLVLAIVARLAIIPAFPNLSDDVYRFIWDGQLWHIGIHPFSEVPSGLIGQHPLLSDQLFSALNSQEYYSIYPPIPQAIFWVATGIAGSDIWLASTIMKAIHAFIDIGTLILIIKTLETLGIARKRVLIYALNPLIIIELVGNLHHEGLVIFFLVGMIYFLSRKGILLSALFFCGAVASKLLPALFFPLIFFFLKGKNRWFFAGYSTIFTLLLFIPVLGDFTIIQNIRESADLYVRKFEFNAGIYYILREIGYVIKGYNTIHVLGPFLMTTSLVLILMLAYRSWKSHIKISQIPALMIWTYLSYALLSITLHPWYIAILIPLTLMTPYKMPILWSGLIFMTYINYSFESYYEPLGLVLLEYAVVFFLLYREWKKYGIMPASYKY